MTSSLAIFGMMAFPFMDDAAKSLSVARCFAGLALKKQPEDFEVVIHAAYYAMHHGARAALLGMRGGPEYSRTPSAAYDLRTLSDYGRAGRDLTGDAAALQPQLREFSTIAPNSQQAR